MRTNDSAAPVGRQHARAIGSALTCLALAGLTLALTPAFGAPASAVLATLSGTDAARAHATVSQAAVSHAGTAQPQLDATPLKAAASQSDVPAKAAPTATAPEPAQPSATAQALTRLEEESLLLKARLKALETEAQIAQRNAELTRLAAAGDRSGFVVRAVEGIGKSLYATLWSRDQGEVEVKAGDTLPNGMRIVAVRPGEVLAQHPRSRKSVARPMAIDARPASAGEQSYAGAPAAGGAVPGIPGIPSIPSLPRY